MIMPKKAFMGLTVILSMSCIQIQAADVTAVAIQETTRFLISASGEQPWEFTLPVKATLFRDYYEEDSRKINSECTVKADEAMIHCPGLGYGNLDVVVNDGMETLAYFNVLDFELAFDSYAVLNVVEVLDSTVEVHESDGPTVTIIYYPPDGTACYSSAGISAYSGFTQCRTEERKAEGNEDETELVQVCCPQYCDIHCDNYGGQGNPGTTRRGQCYMHEGHEDCTETKLNPDTEPPPPVIYLDNFPSF